MQNQDVGVSDYADFSHFLEGQCGIVLGENKHYLLRSRLMPLVRQFSFDDLTSLVKAVVAGHDPQLKESVVDAMTTNETLWFRDTYPFTLLAELLRNDYFSKTRTLKVWSAACSSGQEPYSISMVHDEHQRNSKDAPGMQITATDLSKEMLTRAERAEYDELSLSRGLSPQRRQQYFDAMPGDIWRVNAAIRNKVSFRQLNLLSPSTALQKYDVVFCRNVLIYFSAEVKRRILQQIAASLQPNGILFLGASESISGLSQDFEMVRCSPGLYYRKKS